MGILIRTLILFLVCAVATFGQLTSQGNEQVITYSGSTAFLVTNTPVNPNLLVTTGTNTFIMNVNPPSNSVRLYITNDTANPCNNLTVTVASTGNTALNSFNQNPGAWQALQIQTSGNFAGSQPITLPANGTVAVTSQPIIGSKIAVFVVLSSGCTGPNTNIDVQAVFGAFTATSPFVQGPVAPGASYTGDNPVVVGGVDPNNLNHVITGVMIPQGAIENGQAGWAIGDSGFAMPPTAGGYATGFTYPNGSGGGPLATMDSFLITGGGSVQAGLIVGGSTAGGTQNVNCTAGFNCRGIIVSDSGHMGHTLFSTVSAGTTLIPYGNMDAGGAAEVQTCRVDIKEQEVGGTAPTLDVFFQDSMNNTDWTDRIHFPQCTVCGISPYWASLSGSNSTTTITAYSDAALAVNTMVQGGLQKYLRFKVIATGAGANYNLETSINCK